MCGTCGCSDGADIRLLTPEGTEPVQAGLVTLKTAFGGTRIVDLLVGDPLPRIC